MSLMKVKLDDVLEAIEFANMETEYYYSVKTEEILMCMHGMINGYENPELAEDMEDNDKIISDFQGNMN